ncbi:MAG TPA: ATP-binding protein, partial [Phenylobacterium sp.]
MLLVLASVSCAVAFLATFSILRDGRREVGLQTERLSTTAAVIASLSGEAAAARNPQEAFAAIRSIKAAKGVLYARLETPDGQLLSETGAGARLQSDPKVSGGARVPIVSMFRSHTIQVSAPVYYGRDRVGRVVLLGQIEGAGARAGSSLFYGALAALFAFGIGLGVAWRMQRGIAGPIQALTGAIGELREGHDFARTVQVEADDETADLVDGFNALLSEVRQRDEAISAHMSGLERTVEERTADLQAAKEAADAANSAKSDFLATMSHEIRTPMNGIMVMAEMLAAGEMPPRQRRFAEVIAKSGSSLLAIINDILDFSKIEAGKLDLEAAAVDPAEIAEDVCSLFWERARSKGLDLAAYVDPGVPARIEGDAVRLRQVVGNLVNNAIKFTETGGVLVEVTAPARDRLRIAVRDTGIGIAAEKLPDLFTAFSQADQSTTRRFGGTGLGLAICKRLVEAMDGKLAVRSTPGQGSVFAFEAPIRVLEPPAVPLRAEGVVELRIEGRFTRRAAERYLEFAGLSIAGEGATPGLIIADPAQTPEAAQKAAPVICLGEFGDASPAQLHRAGRIDAVLPQPFRRRDLAALLGAWTSGQPLAEALETEAQSQTDQLPQFAGARVLVADDSAVNREVAMEALARLGIPCAAVGDGREALELLEVESFDLILMDGSMPDIDGYEASREIRRREASEDKRRTPIVALTAHVIGAGADTWREAGMDAVLHKPFTLAGLARALGEFLTPSAEPGEPAPPPVASVPEPEPTPLPPSDLIDPGVAEELAQMARGGRADFVAKVRKLYRDNAPDAAKRVIAAAEQGDVEDAARAAHALKSMSLNIGAKAVADLSARMESDARDRGVADPGLAETLYRKLLATLEVLDGAP